MRVKSILKCVIVLLCLTIFNDGFAQSSVFNPRELFAPFHKNAVNRYRSSNGAPGPSYWQNRADYQIRAAIDTNTNILTGDVRITYFNNSPDTLYDLWLQVDQNIYRENSIADFAGGKSAKKHTEGYQISSLKAGTPGGLSDADYIVSGTMMQVRLRTPLHPGSQKVIDIRYHYEIPGTFGGRTDFFNTKNGKIYEIAQWYPRMAVYDDLTGWNTLPFIGTGEFYCEYGNFDYAITLPAGMFVVGAGELVNENEVYTKIQSERIATARTSDKTIIIRSKTEVERETAKARRKASEKTSLTTWHFKMDNTRDVAFGASAAYMIDAARINLPGGRKALAMSAYPVESDGNSAWSRSTEYLKGAVEHFSSTLAPFPYPVAVNEAGVVGGMEYPGFVFDGYQDKGKTLFWVTAHEIGHTWFPMVVGSNERQNGWMDEGLNTFIDIYASDTFNGGEYAPKRDGEYAPGGGNPADEIIPWIKDTNAPVILERADMITGKYRHPFTYFKPALGLVLLRDEILGKERFDYAFKSYYDRWAYKHPAPGDFFRTIENQAGEDLSYFWRQWFQNNWDFDVAVDSVGYNKEKGYSTIFLTNLQKSAYPLKMVIRYANGKSEVLKIPVEVWLAGAHYSLRMWSDSPVQSVVIDPDNKLPDSNRENNMWPSNTN